MKTEPKNIEAFRKLVERYETITIEEIKEKWLKPSPYSNAAKNITGLGGFDTYSLCVAVNKTARSEIECNYCVYGDFVRCILSENKQTYHSMTDAETPDELLAAFRNRAEHLRNTYPQYL
jgi:hypothetical protein